jgi:hypothetical protein
VSAPLNVVQLSTDTPQVKAGEDGLVDVRAVVAWALTFRPDLVAQAHIEQLSGPACPPGTELSRCRHCSGRGAVCSSHQEVG